MRASSNEALKKLITDATDYLGLVDFKELTFEEFEKITRSGEIPSFQEFYRKDSYRYSKMLEGIYGATLRFQTETGILSDENSLIE